MSLARKDVKVYFDPDIHAGIKALADHDETSMQDYIEQLVAPLVHKRIHETIALAERFRRAGIVRDDRESSADQSPTD